MSNFSTCARHQSGGVIRCPSSRGQQRACEDTRRGACCSRSAEIVFHVHTPQQWAVIVQHDEWLHVSLMRTWFPERKGRAVAPPASSSSARVCRNTGAYFMGFCNEAVALPCKWYTPHTSALSAAGGLLQGEQRRMHGFVTLWPLQEARTRLRLVVGASSWCRRSSAVQLDLRDQSLEPFIDLCEPQPAGDRCLCSRL